MGTKNCGKERRETFKHIIKYHDILCRHDYTEIIVSIFAQKAQSE